MKKKKKRKLRYEPILELMFEILLHEPQFSRSGRQGTEKLRNNKGTGQGKSSLATLVNLLDQTQPIWL